MPDICKMPSLPARTAPRAGLGAPAYKLRDAIESWVNEGGAGDDSAP